MRSKILKAVILFAVFCAGVFLFSGLMNTQVTESASNLEDSTLPVMCVNIAGNRVNRMYGYKVDMEPKQMRDSLIPMTTDREITVSYKAFGNRVKSVSFEVTTPDTGEVIENAKIGGFTTDGDYKTATFSLSKPILMNREYPIKFTVSTSSGDFYYYSRLLQRADLASERYVQFVYDFYESCTNKAGAGEINTYLETDTTVTNNSFTNVNLKSTFDQVTWGSLAPQIYRKAVPTICEINANTCSITNDYLISAAGRNDNTEIYHVFEFYRLRSYNDRIMLLDFNRQAIQVYDGSYGSVSADGVFLGVNTRDVDYVSNSSASIVAFVADYSLWEFNSNSDKLSLVFSFHDTEGDERNDHSDYKIKIIRVAETGDIDFVVYGYMNRGAHEGTMGISLYHFTGDGATLTERAFISYPKSFAYLENDLERLCYITQKGQAYIYLDRTVYGIDPETGTTDVVVEDINPDCIVMAGDNDQIAWAEEMDKNASRNITLVNLESGDTRSITARKGTYVRPLGFINDDFIYGIANEEDIRSRPAGDVLFAMKELKIENFDGKVVKEYNPDNIWVTDVSIKEGLVELTRYTKSGDDYVPASTDNIMNNRQTSAKAINVSLTLSSRQGTVVTLQMPKSGQNLSPLLASFKMKNQTAVPTFDLGIREIDDFPQYYVYGYGKLQNVVTDPGLAIRLADAMVGTAMTAEGQYIYERGNSETENELYNEDVPEAMFAGTLDAAHLQELAGDSATILNLTGCELDQVLYEVSNGRAVVARLADGGTTVIVGYDHYNTLLYNFEDGAHYYMGINDSRATFTAGGNVFISYVEPQKTTRD